MLNQEQHYFWFNGCYLELVTVSIHLFFTWALCIYLILGKGCYILYVFGLNSTVCSHIVGIHFLATRSLITLRWTLTCIIVFYCVCISKVSSNLQCSLAYDAIFYFNLVCHLSLILFVFYYIWYCYIYSSVAFASYCSIHMCDFLE